MNESAQIAKEEEEFMRTEEGRKWYARWVRTQDTAAREQGYANMDHALWATDYKRCWR